MKPPEARRSALRSGWLLRPCLLATLAGCGGGNDLGRPAVASGTEQVTAQAFAQLLGAAASEERETVIFKYNTGGPVVAEDVGTLLRMTVQRLDVAGVPFALTACGHYSAAQTEDGGYAGWPPSAMTFSVNKADLAKVIKVGGEVRGIDGMYIVRPQSCNDVDDAISAPSRIFWYAADRYPELFPGPPYRRSRELGYEYTYFETTGNYIGVKNGRVVVHNGRDWNFLDVGAVTDFISALATPSGPVVR